VPKRLAISNLDGKSLQLLKSFVIIDRLRNGISTAQVVPFGYPPADFGKLFRHLMHLNTPIKVLCIFVAFRAHRQRLVHYHHKITLYFLESQRENSPDLAEAAIASTL
jgi:hypothetical protein